MTERGPGLREMRKARAQRAIQEHAMRLFAERGYDATTVADVSGGAEVSSMTVFRYFSAKEDLVMADEYDPVIVERIRARPAGEPLVQRISAALAESVAGRAPTTALCSWPGCGSACRCPRCGHGCGTASTAASATSSRRCAAGPGARLRARARGGHRGMPGSRGRGDHALGRGRRARRPSRPDDRRTAHHHRTGSHAGRE